MTDNAEQQRITETVAVGKARGIVGLWEVGAYTDAEAVRHAQTVLGQCDTPRVRAILVGMLAQARKKLGWQ